MNRNSGSTALLEAVLDVLRSFANPDGVCELSLREMSRVAGYSKRSICRAIKDLGECKVLLVKHRQKADGTSLRNEYTLCPTRKAA